MPKLEKAILQEIKSDQSRKPIGPGVPVQFNPTSLKLALSNQIEGGRTRGRQRRQYIGSSSSVLSLELVFDTADEAEKAHEEDNANKIVPRSVMQKTNFVEKFVLPKNAGAKETPPKLRFSWGKMIFEGIVEKVDIDFDHFAADGTPLLAKVALSMKEQKAEYQFLKSGPGAAEAPTAREPGAACSGTPGSSAGVEGDKVTTALGGESAAELAVRVGLEPGAWRGLGADLGVGLGLEAGLEVGFSASLCAEAGIGVHVGVDAGADLSVEAAFGLEASAGVNAGFGSSFGASLDADLAAGFAMAAAGGVDAALNSVEIARSENAARVAVEAFEAPVTRPGTALSESGASPGASSDTDGAVSSTRPARPEQVRTPLNVSGTRSPSQQAAAASAPGLPRVDPRARSFGAGAPLRPRTGGGRLEQLAPRVGPGRVERALRFRTDPTTPPWIELPARDAGRAVSDAEQSKRRPNRSCSCRGPCRCHARGGGAGSRKP